MCGGSFFGGLGSILTGGLSDVFAGNQPFTAANEFVAQNNLLNPLIKALRNDPTGLSNPLADTLEYSVWTFGGAREQQYFTLQAYADRLNSLSSIIESKQTSMGNLQADMYHKQFLEWVFQYGDRRAMQQLSTEMDTLTTQYNEIKQGYDALKAVYDQTTALGTPEWTGIFSGTNSIKLATSAVFEIYINIKNYQMTGDSKYLRQAFKVILAVVGLVLSIIAAFYSAGSTLKLVGAMLAILSALIVLDNMFGGGVLMESIMKMTDFMLNDVLQLDKFGAGTERFTKGNEHYQETKTYMQIGILLSSMILTVAGSYCSSSDPNAGAGVSSKSSTVQKGAESEPIGDSNLKSDSSQSVGQETSNNAPQPIGGDGGVFGYISSALEKYGHVTIRANTLESMWSALQSAKAVGDIAKTVRSASELTDKLKYYEIAMQDRINKLAKVKFEVSYEDASYISNQTDMAVNSYALEVSMSEAGQSDVFDPESTIVMNVKYKPELSYTFGFEDMFRYENMAGGDMYAYNMLWR